jgi:hypothetical protein
MFQQLRPCFIVSYHFPTCSHRVSPFFHHESSAARCLEARAGGRPAPLRQHYGGMAPCLGDDKMGRIIICIFVSLFGSFFILLIYLLVYPFINLLLLSDAVLFILVAHLVVCLYMQKYMHVYII